MSNNAVDDELYQKHFLVAIFGSARIKKDNPAYDEVYKLTHMIASENIDIVTGGGPGIMEAANKGAYNQGDSKSVGLGIRLPFEDAGNAFTTEYGTFEYFFSRKVMLVKYSMAYILLPGGFGTLDEVFETLTLMQTGKVEKSTIYLIGVEFYSPLLEFIKGSLLSEGNINVEDLDLIEITDDIDYVVSEIAKKIS